MRFKAALGRRRSEGQCAIGLDAVRKLGANERKVVGAGVAGSQLSAIAPGSSFPRPTHKTSARHRSSGGGHSTRDTASRRPHWSIRVDFLTK